MVLSNLLFQNVGLHMQTAYSGKVVKTDVKV